MENNPRKSKALLITIIIIVLLLIVGFLVYKNRDKFGEKTGSTISRIFSPLTPSVNSKNLKSIDENSERVVAQAGEDIKAGDNLTLSGTDANNNPIVVKAGKGSQFYGFASQDILNGELGEVIINSGSSNSFFETFSNFLNNLFNNNTGVSPPNIDIPTECLNGATNPPLCTINTNNVCVNNTTNPPLCTINTNNTCMNGATNPPLCTINTNNVCVNGASNPPVCTLISGECLNGATNPPLCTINTNNTCLNGATNPPICTVINGECLNGATNPPLCTIFENINKCEDEIDNDQDSLIDDLDPACHAGGTLEGEYLPNHDSEADAPCENGASNPPLCTIFEKEKLSDLTAGAISPTSALSGAQTTISAPISNIGEGGTISNFSSFFTITNQGMGDTEINGGDISKSKFKKLFSKIFKKETWISIVKAATTGNTGVIINVELVAETPKIEAGQTRIITTSYNFNTPGMYYVRVCADKNSTNDTGDITETNEDNNCGPWTAINSTSSLPPPGELPKCSDGIDNDRDRLIDDLDPACHIGGDLENAYVSTHDSESTSPSAVYECNDGIDNDSDNKIDIDDPACHIDGELENDYVSEHDSETIYPSGPEIGEKENICLAVEQNPLVFTDQEKSELAELLRKFYLLAPSLKSEDDISIIYNEIERYKEFIGQLTILTNQCYDQGFRKDGSANPSWDWTPAWDGDGTFSEAPMHRFSNPWFKGKEKTESERYFDNNLISCKYMSGYYSGETKTGGDCDEIYTLTPMCEDFYHPEFIVPGVEDNGINRHHTNAILDGCKWHPGTHFREVELLLNVW